MNIKKIMWQTKCERSGLKCIMITNADVMKALNVLSKNANSTRKAIIALQMSLKWILAAITLTRATIPCVRRLNRRTDN